MGETSGQGLTDGTVPSEGMDVDLPMMDKPKWRLSERQRRENTDLRTGPGRGKEEDAATEATGAEDLEGDNLRSPERTGILASNVTCVEDHTRCGIALDLTGRKRL